MSIAAIAFAKTVDLLDCEGPAARLLLYVLAENTFDDTFVCRLSQEQLALDVRIADRTVRRHLDALETSGIIIRAKRRSSGGNAMPDAIRIVGYKRWYHRDHGGRKRAARGGKPPDKMSGGATGQNVRLQADSRSPAAGGQQESGTYSSPVLTSRTSSTPNPEDGAQAVSPSALKSEAAASAEAGDVSAKQGELIAQLRADAVLPQVVERLLVPVLQQRRFSAKSAIEDLRAARNAARSLTTAHLDKALQLILTSGVGTIKTSRLRDAIEAVSKAGLMVPIRRGTAQWDAWSRHFASAGDQQAAMLQRFDVWQVPSEFPPTHVAAT